MDIRQAGKVQYRMKKYVIGILWRFRLPWPFLHLCPSAPTLLCAFSPFSLALWLRNDVVSERYMKDSARSLATYHGELIQLYQKLLPLIKFHVFEPWIDYSPTFSSKAQNCSCSIECNFIAKFQSERFWNYRRLKMWQNTANDST